MRVQLAPQAQKILGTSDVVMITERVDDVALLIGQTDLPPLFEQAAPYNSLGSLLLWGREGVGVSAYILRKLLGGSNGVPNASRIAFCRASGVGKRVTAVPWTW